MEEWYVVEMCSLKLKSDSNVKPTLCDEVVDKTQDYNRKLTNLPPWSNAVEYQWANIQFQEQTQAKTLSSVAKSIDWASLESEAEKDIQA